MKIDLQLHSTYSDGLFTPEELLAHAKRNNFEIISITDHDSVFSQQEGLAHAKGLNIKFVTGIEISTSYLGKTFHFLGYNVDINNQQLKDLSQKNFDIRKKAVIDKLPEINQQLAALHKNLVDQAHLESSLKYFGKPKVAMYLLELGLVNTKEEGFDLLRLVKYTDIFIDPSEAIKIIHQAGGKAVMSHPLAPTLSLKDITLKLEEQEKIIEHFISAGLDGLEVFQPSHYAEDADTVLNWAKKYNLIYTGGSDWHGPLSSVGERIKKFIPNYVEDFANFTIPEEHALAIAKNLVQ